MVGKIPERASPPRLIIALNLRSVGTWFRSYLNKMCNACVVCAVQTGKFSEISAVREKKQSKRPPFCGLIT